MRSGRGCHSNSAFQVSEACRPLGGCGTRPMALRSETGPVPVSPRSFSLVLRRRQDDNAEPGFLGRQRRRVFPPERWRGIRFPSKERFCASRWGPHTVPPISFAPGITVRALRRLKHARRPRQRRGFPRPMVRSAGTPLRRCDRPPPLRLEGWGHRPRSGDGCCSRSESSGPWLEGTQPAPARPAALLPVGDMPRFKRSGMRPHSYGSGVASIFLDKFY
jgi:hypothetical protein